MADYFSDFGASARAQGLPSPAGTPYETPALIRSLRLSRVTPGSSREPSITPPPLPPEPTDYQERTRDSTFPAVDPRQFTPTLHASLVSEIWNLRRELDSKNGLVENLEASLSATKTENEALSEQISRHVREIRTAEHQVQQVEQNVHDAMDELVEERDAARQGAQELRSKLDLATKRVRLYDEETVRAQDVWENEKAGWENERRQLERCIHITENRLRAFVEERSAQQAAVEAQNIQNGDFADGHMFKDVRLINESDVASIRSTVNPTNHRRNMSSTSFTNRSIRFSTSSRTTVDTSELRAKSNGCNLADELDIDQGDEYDPDDIEHADDRLDSPRLARRAVESHQTSAPGDCDSEAERFSDLASHAPGSILAGEHTESSLDATTQPAEQPNSDASVPPAISQQPEPVRYVDTGYQPSPPPSPHGRGVSSGLGADAVSAPVANERRTRTGAHFVVVGKVMAARRALEAATREAATPISPPQTPGIDEMRRPEDKRMSIPKPFYSNSATQTEPAQLTESTTVSPKRDSLIVPMFVPSIAIHPPSSRPSSPKPHVLPPGTKSVSTQASLPWPGRDACMQTEEIRVDRRLRKLPSHLLPASLDQDPAFTEKFRPQAAIGGTTKVVIEAANIPSPPLQSPAELNPPLPRASSAKDLRTLPLRAIPLPRPVLSPRSAQSGPSQDGPLNRSCQYGVTRPLQTTSQLLDVERDSDASDYDQPSSDGEPNESVPPFIRAPPAPFGLSGHPEVVPEDKEPSPGHWLGHADSQGAAPAPSIASSRATSQQRSRARPSGKRAAYQDPRSRSPSLGSVVSSSSYSVQSAQPPPFPIPTRFSSRPKHSAHSEGSQSPTPCADIGRHGRGDARSLQARQDAKRNSLRKVQSANVIRSTARGKASPQKGRRRRRSPNLTPIQSMALETPASLQLPVPNLPIPTHDKLHPDMVQDSVDLTSTSSPGAASIDHASQEADLVDAIAATMVGEWMWKYVRKRKSFGTGEDGSEFGTANQNGPHPNTNHGARHKRWVWLSPYERAIMWDTKQPTAECALMGKKGRKLLIQSVVDVQDDTPVPKGADASMAVSRSILVLTPARALKFTATSRERHELWMSALSFLARPEGLAAPPPTVAPRPTLPISAGEVRPRATRSRSPSREPSTIRNTAHVTKCQRPELHHSASQPAASTTSAMISVPDAVPRDEGADFPAIPRLYSNTTRHQRKRSHTSPRLPPALSTLRSLSSSSSSASKLHLPSTTTTTINGSSSSSSRPVHPPGSSSFQPTNAPQRAASSSATTRSPDRPNFFEAIDTVRMDAFVDPNLRDGVLYVPAAPPAQLQSQSSKLVPASRLRRYDSNGQGNSAVTMADRRRAGLVPDEEEEGVGERDPFKGF